MPLRPILLFVLGYFIPVCLVFPSANPLQGIEWTPPAWSPDGAKNSHENLIDLLTGLEAAAAEQEDLWFLVLQFSSVRRLVTTYPPTNQQAADLIDTFTDVNKGAGLEPYTLGKREFLVAYDSVAGGVLSYVRCTLPNKWQPQARYPLFVWGRGGGDTPYPGDVTARYNDQISGVTIPGTPSAVYKDGYTIIPGGLGGRSYVGTTGDDFIEGIEIFRSHFLTDPRRMYMGGFSNGGKATYLIAAQTMDLYHWAALGMCAPAVRNDGTLTPEYAAPLVDTPVWMAVGADDPNWLLPTRSLRDLLTGIGNSPEFYYERPETAHSWLWEFQDPMYLWMRPKEYIYPGGPPPAPTNFHVTGLRDTELTLEWDLPEGSDSQIMIDWMLVGISTGFLPIPRAILPAGTTSHKETGLKAGITYRYRVWAYDKTGDSEYSEEIEVTTRAEGALTWADWPMDPDYWVDTGSFLGWLNVSGDWVWSGSLSNWLYLPERIVTPQGAWVYLLH